MFDLWVVMTCGLMGNTELSEEHDVSVISTKRYNAQDIDICINSTCLSQLNNGSI